MPGLAAIETSMLFSMREPRMLSDAVTDLLWSPLNDKLYAASAAGEIEYLDTDGKLLTQWQAHQGGVTRLRLQPNHPDVLASAGEDGRVVLWNSADGSEQSTLINESDWIEHLDWTPDGNVLAAAARKTISLWRGAESLGMWYDARRQVLAMAWAPDGKRLATAANKGLYLWRMQDAGNDSSEPMQLLSFPGAPVSLAWQPNSKALAVGTQDGFLQIWRPADNAGGKRNESAKQLTMRGYPGKVNCLAWHPTTTTIATAGGPDVVLWQLTHKGTKGNPLRHHQSTVTAITWSPDGTLLASGDRAGRLCIWDSEGDPVFSQKLDHEISTLGWRNDSLVLAIGDTGGALHLVDRNRANPPTSTTSPDEEAHVD